MEEFDINVLMINECYLIENTYEDIIIVGKVDKLKINFICDQLDLSRLECDTLIYYNQEGNSIKNHILPNSLKYLYCYSDNLKALPDFSHIEQEIKLYFSQDKPIYYIPYNPNLKLGFYNVNNIDYIDTKYYRCNSVSRLDKLDKYMDLIAGLYNINHINIEGYENNPITNQKDLDKYLDYQFHKMNKIKSAKK